MQLTAPLQVGNQTKRQPTPANIPHRTHMQGEGVLLRHIAITETLIAAKGAADVALALSECERQLAAEGKLSEEWVDVWQAPWRK